MGGYILAGKNTRNNIIKMKKRQNPWTGIMLILFSVYIIVLFVQSLNQDNISIYEVTQNKLADDDTIRGVILRDEHLIKAKSSGYINYYVGEGARIGVNTTIYSVDRTGGFNDSLDKEGADNYSLSDEILRPFVQILPNTGLHLTFLIIVELQISGIILTIHF